VAVSRTLPGSSRTARLMMILAWCSVRCRVLVGAGGKSQKPAIPIVRVTARRARYAPSAKRRQGARTGLTYAGLQSKLNPRTMAVEKVSARLGRRRSPKPRLTHPPPAGPVGDATHLVKADAEEGRQSVCKGPGEEFLALAASSAVRIGEPATNLPSNWSCRTEPSCREERD
jgi:hypothetical protein